MRYVIPIVAVLALVGALVAVKGKQIGMLMKAGKAAEAAGPPPEVVGSAAAKRETWAATLSAVGSVEAGRGVTVSNDAPGVVQAIRFSSGARVRAGEVLVELDSSVERAQLASVLARRELATTTAGRTRALVEANALAGAQLDADNASLKTVSADAAALQAQIARKVVRAPFAGRLGIRQVNVGQYLGPGTPITVLESTDDTYVDFSVPQQRLAEIPVGTKVALTVAGVPGEPLAGAVAAVDPTVDESTRQIKLRATVTDKEKRLRPGMFVNVAIELGAQRDSVIVPATAVVHASYGDSVFVVEDGASAGKATKVARQRFVRTGEMRGDFVAIDDGLKGDETVVAVGAFKLRNGAPIAIKADGGAPPQLAPKPENR